MNILVLGAYSGSNVRCEDDVSPPYNPAVTSFLNALTLSRAMTLAPMAA